MSQATPLLHLAFLSSYDEDGRAAYVRALVRVLAAEHEFAERDDGRPGWRITQQGDPDHGAVWVRIKAGYVQKLVNEGVLAKVAVDDDAAHYRLDVPDEELVAEVRAAAEYLDNEHRNLLKDLPYW